MKLILRVAAWGLVGLWIPLPAAGQGGIQLSVSLQDAPGNPGAVVAVTGVFGDDRFLNALKSGFPLRLDFLLELRERRENWFDRRVGGFGWDYVIAYDPVRDQFLLDDGFETLSLPTPRALRDRVETRYDAGSYPPDQDGTYYYRATLEAVTVSDEDVDEVYAWLRGDADSSSRRSPSPITRMARRLLVQVAPLPRESASANSATFRWP